MQTDKLSFSILLHHTERKRSASYRNEMEMLHIVELERNNASSSGVFYEAFCGAAAKYEAQLTLHEAALRAMKRSLTASCFFAQIWAKKMVDHFLYSLPT